MSCHRYTIDAQDRITGFGDGTAQAGPRFDGANALIGRTWWTCIEDVTTQELYRSLVEVARKRREVRVPYRCDTAQQRRWFEMRIAALGGGGVEFTSVLQKEVTRPSVALLEEDTARDGRLVRMCSWCQQVALPDGRWFPIETAMAQMRLLETDTLPRITHGICPDCAAELRRQLEFSH